MDFVQFIYRPSSNGEPDHPAVTVFGGRYLLMRDQN